MGRHQRFPSFSSLFFSQPPEPAPDFIIGPTPSGLPTPYCRRGSCLVPPESEGRERDEVDNPDLDCTRDDGDYDSPIDLDLSSPGHLPLFSASGPSCREPLCSVSPPHWARRPTGQYASRRMTPKVKPVLPLVSQIHQTRYPMDLNEPALRAARKVLQAKDDDVLVRNDHTLLADEEEAVEYTRTVTIGDPLL